MGNKDSKSLNFKPVEDFIDIQRFHNDEFIVTLNENIIKQLKEKQNIRLITFAGKTGIGKSTALNTLLL